MNSGRGGARRVVARMRGEGADNGRIGVHERSVRDYPPLTPVSGAANMQGTEHDVWWLDIDFEYREGKRLQARGEEATPRRYATTWPARVLG